MGDRHDDFEEQCRLANERYMATLYPSFRQRLWAHWKRLFLTVLVNGFILGFPFAYVVFQAWALENQRHPTLAPLPTVKLDPAVAARIDAAMAELHAREAKGVLPHRSEPTPTLPVDYAILADADALVAQGKRDNAAIIAGKKVHRNP